MVSMKDTPTILFPKAHIRNYYCCLFNIHLETAVHSTGIEASNLSGIFSLATGYHGIAVGVAAMAF